MEDTAFDTNTIQKVFESSFKNKNSRANKEALQLSSEFFKLFTIEAIQRASEEQETMSRATNNTTSRTVQVEHLERILPQLLLDF